MLKVSPQFDVNNQTPAEQWNKKSRLANRVKATDIFKIDPKKPEAHRERRTLGVIHNLKFHGEETRKEKVCSYKQLSRSKVQHCTTKVKGLHQKKQLFRKEQGMMLDLFSSESIHSSNQNVMTDEISVFRPGLTSTPCTKNTEAQNTTKTNCNLDVLIPDPSPNVFRWCEGVSKIWPDEYQSVRNTVAEKHTSTGTQSHNTDSTKSNKEEAVEDKSLSILALATPMHNGDYVMPYSKANT